MEGTRVDVDHLLDGIPVNASPDVRLLSMGGELVVHASLFTPALRDALTFVPESTASSSNQEEAGSYRGYRYYGGDAVGIPRTFGMRAFPNAQIKPPLQLGFATQLNTTKDRFPFTTRPFPSQVEAIDTVVDHLIQSPEHSCILVAPCGTGKTVMALKAYHQLCDKLHRNLRAIFVVYVDRQLQQAVQRIQDHCDDSVRVGIFRGKERPNPSDHIAVCSFDTLRNLRDSAELRHFDVTIFDEAHHMASETRILTVARAIPCLYRLAITATLTRSDDLQKVVSYIAGPLVYKAKRKRWEMDVWNIPFYQPGFQPATRGKQVMYYKTVMKVMKHSGFIAAFAKVVRYVVEELHHKVCVACKYIEPLKMLDKELGVPWTGLCIGAKTKPEKEAQTRALRKRCVLGTEQVIRESVDEDFTCVMALSSMKHLGGWEQYLGRATRSISPQEGERAPLVVDFYHTHPIFKYHHTSTRPDRPPGRHEFNLAQKGFSIYSCSLDGRHRRLVRARAEVDEDGNVIGDARVIQKPVPPQ